MPSRMMTTSLPASTRRLAFSMVSSATWVCSSLGRSNVDEITSPLTVRRMSVTSSGRSSMSSTMSFTSGLFCSIDLAIVFITVVLPAFGGDTMMPRWPLPIGDTRSMIRAVMLPGSDGSSRRRFSSGNSGGEVLEPGPPLGRLGVATVDRQHLEQGRVLLVAAGRPARAGDVVALAQAVLAGQLHRDVGVVATRQVALDPQEAVALVAHVEVARHGDVLVAGHRLRLEIGLDHRRRVVALRPVGAAPALAPAAPTAVAGLARLAVALLTVLAGRPGRPAAVGRVVARPDVSAPRPAASAARGRRAGGRRGRPGRRPSSARRRHRPRARAPTRRGARRRRRGRPRARPSTAGRPRARRRCRTAPRSPAMRLGAAAGVNGSVSGAAWARLSGPAAPLPPLLGRRRRAPATGVEPVVSRIDSMISDFLVRLFAFSPRALAIARSWSLSFDSRTDCSSASAATGVTSFSVSSECWDPRRAGGAQAGG